MCVPSASPVAWAFPVLLWLGTVSFLGVLGVPVALSPNAGLLRSNICAQISRGGAPKTASKTKGSSALGWNDGILVGDSTLCDGRLELEVQGLEWDLLDKNASSNLIKIGATPLITRKTSKQVKYEVSDFMGAIYGFSKDGYYTLYLNWGNDNAGDVTGHSTFLNMHGYLSAERYPLMKFYAAMAIMYAILGIIWALLMALNSKDLLQLQFWVGAVIMIGVVEMTVCWADLDQWNDSGNHGVRSNGLMVFAKLLTATKNTLSRLLVLVVAMGFGVVKPRLGDVKKQIGGLGLAAFVLFAIYGVVHEQSSMGGGQ